MSIEGMRRDWIADAIVLLRCYRNLGMTEGFACCPECGTVGEKHEDTCELDRLLNDDVVKDVLG